MKVRISIAACLKHERFADVCKNIEILAGLDPLPVKNPVYKDKLRIYPGIQVDERTIFVTPDLVQRDLVDYRVVDMGIYRPEGEEERAIELANESYVHGEIPSLGTLAKIKEKYPKNSPATH